MKTIRAVVVPVDGEPYVTEINHQNGLAQLQELVGGYIEGFDLKLKDGIVTAYVNEEGKLQNLPVNEMATLLFLSTYDRLDLIAGPMVVVGAPDEEGYDTSLPTSIIDAFGAKMPRYADHGQAGKAGAARPGRPRLPQCELADCHSRHASSSVRQ
jgi:Domain of unknown function (DUF3846)